MKSFELSSQQRTDSNSRRKEDRSYGRIMFAAATSLLILAALAGMSGGWMGIERRLEVGQASMGVTRREEATEKCVGSLSQMWAELTSQPKTDTVTILRALMKRRRVSPDAVINYYSGDGQSGSVRVNPRKNEVSLDVMSHLKSVDFSFAKHKRFSYNGQIFLVFDNNAILAANDDTCQLASCYMPEPETKEMHPQVADIVRSHMAVARDSIPCTKKTWTTCNAMGKKCHVVQNNPVHSCHQAHFSVLYRCETCGSCDTNPHHVGPCTSVFTHEVRRRYDNQRSKCTALDMDTNACSAPLAAMNTESSNTVKYLGLYAGIIKFVGDVNPALQAVKYVGASFGLANSAQDKDYTAKLTGIKQNINQLATCVKQLPVEIASKDLQGELGTILNKLLPTNIQRATYVTRANRNTHIYAPIITTRCPFSVAGVIRDWGTRNDATVGQLLPYAVSSADMCIRAFGAMYADFFTTDAAKATDWNTIKAHYGTTVTTVHDIRDGVIKGINHLRAYWLNNDVCGFFPDWHGTANDKLNYLTNHILTKVTQLYNDINGLKLYCNVRDRVAFKESIRVGGMWVREVEECASLCAKNANCECYNFVKGRGDCQLERHCVKTLDSFSYMSGVCSKFAPSPTTTVENVWRGGKILGSRLTSLEDDGVDCTSREHCGFESGGYEQREGPGVCKCIGSVADAMRIGATTAHVGLRQLVKRSNYRARAFGDSQRIVVPNVLSCVSACSANRGSRRDKTACLGVDVDERGGNGHVRCHFYYGPRVQAMELEAAKGFSHFEIF